MNPPPRHGAWLLVLLGLAITLRAGLAIQGGQLVFSDEGRFLRSIVLYRGLAGGEWHPANGALATPQHVAFVYLGTLLAPVAHALAWLAGTGDWGRATEIHSSLPFVAMVVGAISSLNVWLVFRVARAWGAAETEALFSALLCAVSVSLLYQARHLLPYDAALAAFLAGLWLAAKAGTARQDLACGAWAGAGFALYNGYWFLVPVLGAALVLRQTGLRRRCLSAAAFSGGAAGLFGLLMLPGTLIGGLEFWKEFVHFSGTVRQGLFAEGWSFPVEYLAQTEAWFGLAVLAAITLTVITERSSLPLRFKHWLLLAGLIYALLALASTGLEKFVVYGRSVRPLTLLLCLLGGHALARCWPTGGGARATVVAVLLGAAALNITPHFSIGFPTEVCHEVWRDHGVPKLALCYRGTIADLSWPPVTRPDLALLNAAALYPVKEVLPMPAGRVLAKWRHPLLMAVYLYEGHTPRERRLLRLHPPVIQLLQPDQPDTLTDQPPLEILGQPGDLPDGYDGGAAP